MFKFSAAPYHNWSRDVYDRVPTIITTWLAIMPKILIILLILQLQSGLGNTLTLLFDNVTFDVIDLLLLFYIN